MLNAKPYSVFERRKGIVAFAAIAVLLLAAFGMPPISAQTFVSKIKTPTYIRAPSEPSNTCVVSGDDTRCATASTNGIAEVKIVENTLGTWWAKGYHEMDGVDGISGPPSSGFEIQVTHPGYYMKFTSYLEGKVQIQKNGKTVEARYGGYTCYYDAWAGWLCDRWFYAKKDTDGTHTIPSFTGITTFRSVTSPVKYTMGSLFECMTTGTGGTVTHTRCDAYDGDKYWKSNQLYMDWPNI
jgi:hypothetical protein